MPRVAAVLAKALKPIAGLFVVVIIGFGIYANMYLIELIDAPVTFVTSRVAVKLYADFLCYIKGAPLRSLTGASWIRFWRICVTSAAPAMA